MAHCWWATALWLLLQQFIVCVQSQANEACSNPGEVRLTGGATEYLGVVEYCYAGEYHSLCSTGNTTQDKRLAETVCREILNTTDPDITASYVVRDDVELLQLTCTPSPTTLTQCSVTTTNCSVLDVACHGSCDNNVGRCRCIAGWGGTGCRTAMCNPECLNGGSCFRPPGECDCTLVSPRWGGERCNQFECSPVCGNRGVCVGSGQCECVSGYTGSTCLQAVCIPPCENGGRCNRPTQPCICPVRDGWTGQACTEHTCYSFMAPSGCLNGGTCVGPNNCSCTTDWQENRCQTPVCEPQCLNGGRCTAPGQCTCATGWTGDTCDQAVCEPQCLNGGMCTAPGQCTCATGWTGDTCDQAICIPGCENRGNCTLPGTCACTALWTGLTCAQPVCENECQNGGTCTNPNECSCTAGWSGYTCTIPYCACENGGTCVAPGNCSCTEEWEGLTCTQAICSDNFCANGGNCSYPDTNCTCPDQWAGPQCLTALCKAGFCENGGTCLYPDTNCTCPDGWNGDRCEIALCHAGFCENGGACMYPDTNCTCPDGWDGNRCEIALCEDDFCENGGTCLYPDTNCTCPYGWDGDKCEIGLNLFVVLGAGVPAALVAFCILCIAIPYFFVRSRSKALKSKKYSESSIPGNEYEISKPIDNPFTSGHALTILNPAMKKAKNKHNSPAPTEPAHETAVDPVPPEVQNIQTRAVTAAITRWQITAPDELSTDKKATPPPSSPSHSKIKEKETQKSGMSEGWSTIPWGNSKTGESQDNETLNIAYGAIHKGDIIRETSKELSSTLANKQLSIKEKKYSGALIAAIYNQEIYNQEYNNQKPATCNIDEALPNDANGVKKKEKKGLVDSMQLHTNAAYETLHASTLESVTLPAKESPLQLASLEESLHDYTEVLDIINPSNSEKDCRNAVPSEDNVKSERKPTPSQHVEVLPKLDSKAFELFESYYEEIN